MQFIHRRGRGRRHTKRRLATAFAGAMLIACAPGGQDSPTGAAGLGSDGEAPNLVRNPGCDSDTSGWTSWQGRLTRRTDGPHSGKGYCRVQRTAGTAYTFDDSPATVANPLEDARYEAVAWVRSKRSEGRPVALILRQRGGTEAASVVSSDPLALTGAWQRLELATTIDAPGRQSLEVYVAQLDARAGDELDIDDVSLSHTSDCGSQPQSADGGTETNADGGTETHADVDSGTSSQDPSIMEPRTRRPFNDDSPYNMPIPNAPKLDPNTARAAMINRATPGMSLYYFSPRIYEVDGDTTRRVKVSCTEPWGTCELEDATQNAAGGVPIPNGARGAPEDDGHMVIWDIKNQLSYDFWRYRYPNNSAPEGQTSWAGVVSTAGNGVDDPAGRLAAGGSTGANMARLGGMVRVEEVKAGVIPHALVGGTSNSCSWFRWPARKSDGSSDRSDCIPEGARMQLNPSIDLDTVQNMRPIDRMVAEALQVYGWYNIDNGYTSNGNNETMWGVQFEVDPDATGAGCPQVGHAYCEAGARGEYDALQGTLPDGSYLFSHMRVLNSWNGQ